MAGMSSELRHTDKIDFILTLWRGIQNYRCHAVRSSVTGGETCRRAYRASFVVRVKNPELSALFYHAHFFFFRRPLSLREVTAFD